MCDGAERQDRVEARQGTYFYLEKPVAGSDLGGFRLVLRRHAAHRIGDAAIDEGEPVIGALGIGAAGEAKFTQGLIEEYAGKVAGEGTSGPVGAAQAGREPDDEQAHILAAERGDGRVVPIGKERALRAAERGKPWTKRAIAIGLRLARRSAAHVTPRFCGVCISR